MKRHFLAIFAFSLVAFVTMPLLGVQEDNSTKSEPAGDDGRMFGTYRLSLSGAKPQFRQIEVVYGEHYGKESIYPSLSVGWYPFDYFLTAGVTFGIGYYKDSGRAYKQQGSLLLEDDSGPTELTLIPMQLGLSGLFTPFRQKWIVLEGRVGFERLYWQEIRVSDDSSESAGGSSDGGLSNRGYKSASVMAVAVNLSLNPLDYRAAATLDSSLGMNHIYAAPYYEVTSQTKTTEQAVFSRKVYGLAFVFETTQ